MFDAFLKITGIPGESIDPFHKGWIDILAYGIGISQLGERRPRGGGAGAGRAVPEDLRITTHVGAASPKLFQACATGQHFPDAVLDVVIQGEGENAARAEYKFSDVMISSFRDGGTAKLNVEMGSSEALTTNLTESQTGVPPTLSLNLLRPDAQPAEDISISFVKIELTFVTEGGGITNSFFDFVKNR